MTLSNAVNAEVLATVDGKPITSVQVDREIARTLRGKEIDAESLALLKKTTIEQLVRRQLVMKYLGQQKVAASQQDIDFAVDQLKLKLKQQELTLEDHLKKIGFSEADMRQMLAWQIGWRRYLDQICHR